MDVRKGADIVDAPRKIRQDEDDRSIIRHHHYFEDKYAYATG